MGVALTNKALIVDNSGGFIRPEDLYHIFEPFYQADASHTQRGFGLGLAIVKKIVVLHGWQIGVSSSVEAGTQFVVEFAAFHRNGSAS